MRILWQIHSFGKITSFLLILPVFSLVTPGVHGCTILLISACIKVFVDELFKIERHFKMFADELFKIERHFKMFVDEVVDDAL